MLEQRLVVHVLILHLLHGLLRLDLLSLLWSELRLLSWLSWRLLSELLHWLLRLVPTLDHHLLVRDDWLALLSNDLLLQSLLVELLWLLHGVLLLGLVLRLGCWLLALESLLRNNICLLSLPLRLSLDRRGLRLLHLIVTVLRLLHNSLLLLIGLLLLGKNLLRVDGNPLCGVGLLLDLRLLLLASVTEVLTSSSYLTLCS